ncbi:MAG: A/G-specific adenine glycosylase [Paludibacteraceae bacterium]
MTDGKKEYFCRKENDMEFSDAIISWYLVNKRDLPWRDTNDPYRIWISEIILQQTKVAQGLSYYNRFIEKFPNATDLASASEDEVLKEWQGLGYYSRARNLHSAAKSISEIHDGKFPTSYESIRLLKGVGDYTAAAICSFAYNQPYAVVDGNVYRVLSRVFEISTPIDSTNGKKEFAKLAQELINPRKAALHNQAIMDLGAMVCTPDSPLCEECPVSEICLVHTHNTESSYPVKGKKSRQRDRYFYYFFIQNEGKTYLHRREGDDIWKGLYEFPLIEGDKELTEVETMNISTNNSLPEFRNIRITKTHPTILHILSHQRIHAHFIEATAEYKSENASTYKEINISNIQEYAISRLTESFLTKKLR